MMACYGQLIKIKKDGSEGAVFSVTKNEISFGSLATCDVRLALPGVEQIHCTLLTHPNSSAHLRNFSSSNPVLVNEKPVPKNAVIQEGDRISILHKTFMWRSAPTKVDKMSRKSIATCVKSPARIKSSGKRKSEPIQKLVAVVSPVRRSTDNQSLGNGTRLSQSFIAGVAESVQELESLSQNVTVRRRVNIRVSPSSAKQKPRASILHRSILKSVATPRANKSVTFGHLVDNSPVSSVENTPQNDAIWNVPRTPGTGDFNESAVSSDSESSLSLIDLTNYTDPDIHSFTEDASKISEYLATPAMSLKSEPSSTPDKSPERKLMSRTPICDNSLIDESTARSLLSPFNTRRSVCNRLATPYTRSVTKPLICFDTPATTSERATEMSLISFETPVEAKSVLMNRPLKSATQVKNKTPLKRYSLKAKASSAAKSESSKRTAGIESKSLKNSARKVLIASPKFKLNGKNKTPPKSKPKVKDHTPRKSTQIILLKKKAAPGTPVLNLAEIFKTPVKPNAKTPMKPNPGVATKTPMRPNPGVSTTTPMKPNLGVSTKTPMKPSLGVSATTPMKPNPGVSAKTPMKPSLGVSATTPMKPNLGVSAKTPMKPSLGVSTKTLVKPNLDVTMKTPVKPEMKKQTPGRSIPTLKGRSSSRISTSLKRKTPIGKTRGTYFPIDYSKRTSRYLPTTNTKTPSKSIPKLKFTAPAQINQRVNGSNSNRLAPSDSLCENQEKSIETEEISGVGSESHHSIMVMNVEMPSTSGMLGANTMLSEKTLASTPGNSFPMESDVTTPETKSSVAATSFKFAFKSCDPSKTLTESDFVNNSNTLARVTHSTPAKGLSLLQSSAILMETPTMTPGRVAYNSVSIVNESVLLNSTVDDSSKTPTETVTPQRFGTPAKIEQKDADIASPFFNHSNVFKTPLKTPLRKTRASARKNSPYLLNTEGSNTKRASLRSATKKKSRTPARSTPNASDEEGLSVSLELSDVFITPSRTPARTTRNSTLVNEGTLTMSGSGFNEMLKTPKSAKRLKTPARLNLYTEENAGEPVSQDLGDTYELTSESPNGVTFDRSVLDLAETHKTSTEGNGLDSYEASVSSKLDLNLSAKIQLNTSAQVTRNSTAVSSVSKSFNTSAEAILVEAQAEDDDVLSLTTDFDEASVTSPETSTHVTHNSTFNETSKTVASPVRDSLNEQDLPLAELGNTPKTGIEIGNASLVKAPSVPIILLNGEVFQTPSKSVGLRNFTTRTYNRSNETEFEYDEAVSSTSSFEGAAKSPFKTPLRMAPRSPPMGDTSVTSTSNVYESPESLASVKKRGTDGEVDTDETFENSVNLTFDLPAAMVTPLKTPVRVTRRTPVKTGLNETYLPDNPALLSSDVSIKSEITANTPIVNETHTSLTLDLSKLETSAKTTLNETYSPENPAFLSSDISNKSKITVNTPIVNETQTSLILDHSKIETRAKSTLNETYVQNKNETGLKTSNVTITSKTPARKTRNSSIINTVADSPFLNLGEIFKTPAKLVTSKFRTPTKTQQNETVDRDSEPVSPILDLADTFKTPSKTTVKLASAEKSKTPAKQINNLSATRRGGKVSKTPAKPASVREPKTPVTMNLHKTEIDYKNSISPASDANDKFKSLSETPAKQTRNLSIISSGGKVSRTSEKSASVKNPKTRAYLSLYATESDFELSLSTSPESNDDIKTPRRLTHNSSYSKNVQSPELNLGEIFKTPAKFAPVKTPTSGNLNSSRTAGNTSATQSVNLGKLISSALNTANNVENSGLISPLKSASKTPANLSSSLNRTAGSPLAEISICQSLNKSSTSTAKTPVQAASNVSTKENYDPISSGSQGKNGSITPQKAVSAVNISEATILESATEEEGNSSDQGTSNSFTIPLLEVSPPMRSSKSARKSSHVPPAEGVTVLKTTSTVELKELSANGGKLNGKAMNADAVSPMLLDKLFDESRSKLQSPSTSDSHGKVNSYLNSVLEWKTSVGCGTPMFSPETTMFDFNAAKTPNVPKDVFVSPLGASDKSSEELDVVNTSVRKSLKQKRSSGSVSKSLRKKRSSGNSLRRLSGSLSKRNSFTIPKKRVSVGKVSNRKLRFDLNISSSLELSEASVTESGAEAEAESIFIPRRNTRNSKPAPKVTLKVKTSPAARRKVKEEPKEVEEIEKKTTGKKSAKVQPQPKLEAAFKRPKRASTKAVKEVVPPKKTKLSVDSVKSEISDTRSLRTRRTTRVKVELEEVEEAKSTTTSPAGKKRKSKPVQQNENLIKNVDGECKKTKLITETTQENDTLLRSQRRTRSTLKEEPKKPVEEISVAPKRGRLPKTSKKPNSKEVIKKQAEVVPPSQRKTGSNITPKTQVKRSSRNISTGPNVENGSSLADGVKRTTRSAVETVGKSTNQKLLIEEVKEEIPVPTAQKRTASKLETGPSKKSGKKSTPEDVSVSPVKKTRAKSGAGSSKSISRQESTLEKITEETITTAIKKDGSKVTTKSSKIPNRSRALKEIQTPSPVQKKTRTKAVASSSKENQENIAEPQQRSTRSKAEAKPSVASSKKRLSTGKKGRVSMVIERRVTRSRK